MTNRMPMSDEDAKKELDEINAKIAEEKGLDPKTGEPLDKKIDPPQEEEPEDKKKKEESPKEEEDKDEPADDKKLEEEGDEPAKERKSRYIPLSKYQDTKKTLEASNAKKDAEIAELSKKLADIDTAKARDAKVKAYAEKHGKTEEEVRELLEIQDVPAPEAPKKTDAPAVELSAADKKAAAESAFKTELDGLIEELPEAKDHADKVRELAFKKGNETKSLYEIFMREIKPELPSKKKTGESGRGAAGRESGKTPDFAKIAADIKANKPGVLEALNGEEQDAFFDWADKNGSRYTRK